MGLLNSPVLGSPLYGHAWSFWVCIWVAAAVSALLGVVIGAPTLRVRGDYLAIITLGFGEIIPVAIRNLGDVTIEIGGWRPIERLNLTGGENGVNPAGRLRVPGLDHAALHGGPRRRRQHPRRGARRDADHGLRPGRLVADDVPRPRDRPHRRRPRAGVDRPDAVALVLLRARPRARDAAAAAGTRRAARAADRRRRRPRRAGGSRGPAAGADRGHSGLAARARRA